ncbi:UTRA domain-containing protein [uncultured Tateyamaria sp.]|uniref:GntR family transcriptional regulator n=1 Tax=uncultured Tateyamaria sp. TaxID=455651 RepID=UPI002601B15A|nr:UTRA domain-containing protein [uncultured Tateyamaria sp.]
MQESQCWKNVYRRLASDISAGEFCKGAKLPSQSDLASRYQTGRHAIRRALERLSVEGVISTRQGKAAVLVGLPITYHIDSRTRFASRLREAGYDVRVTALRVSDAKSASVQVAKMLNLNARDKVGFAELIHHVNGVPTALGRHYFNTHKFPDILKEISQTEPSVPDAFRRIGVSDYARRSTIVEVRQPTAYEALILEIPPTQPVLELLGQNVADPSASIEVTEAIVRADTVKLRIEGHQVGDLA